jgi:hypothetical protein
MARFDCCCSNDFININNMKIYINKYRDHWLSPYTVLEKVFFWREIDYDEPVIKRWSDRLLPISEGLRKFLDVVHPKVDYVKIDKWDTWSMDHTLAKIALPMLKQLQATKHGSPVVDLEDVPEELRGTSTPDYDEQLTFEFYDEARKDRDVDYELVHKRWDWVLNEMIFAFEHKVDDSWEDAFRSGEHDIIWVEEEKEYNGQKLHRMERGPNDTYECDYEGMQKVHDRMANGFKLFGKYYQGLWD